jgi:hypothetical protein
MSLATESPGMATRSDAQNHVASKLTTPQLHRALLTSEPVAKIFQALGRQAPGAPP